MSDDEKAPSAETKNALRELIENASANPAELKFPTDRWGFTAQVRRAVLLANGTIADNKEKHDLLINTLYVLIAHTKKRYQKNVQDAPERRKRLQRVQESTAQKQKQNYGSGK